MHVLRSVALATALVGVLPSCNRACVRASQSLDYDGRSGGEASGSSSAGGGGGARPPIGELRVRVLTLRPPSRIAGTPSVYVVMRCGPHWARTVESTGGVSAGECRRRFALMHAQAHPARDARSQALARVTIVATQLEGR